MKQRPLLTLFLGCWLGEAMMHIHWAMVIIALFLLCIFFFRYGRGTSKRSAFLLFVGVCMGSVAGFLFSNKILNQESLVKEQVIHSIVGRVDWKNQREKGYSLTLCNLYDTETKQHIEGNAIVYIDNGDDIYIGNRVLCVGKLETYEEPSNLGEFSLRNYYMAKEVYFHMFPEQVTVVERNVNEWYSLIGKGKEVLYQRIEKNYKNEVLELMEAMVLGDKSELSFETKDIFQSGGILHVLAISGLHISLLGASVFRRLRRVGIGFYPSFVFCFFLLASYCVMTGNSVSGLRATMMLCIYMFGQCMGRSYDLLTGLAGSGMVLLLQCPARAVDSSFVYSVLAIVFIGMIQLSSHTNQKKQSWIQRSKENLRFCILLQLGMLPVSIYFQYEFYLLSFLSNFLLLPFVSVGFLCGIISLILPCRIIVWITQEVFQLVVYGVRIIATIGEQRIVTGYVPFVYIILLYTLLGLVWLNKKRIICFLLFVTLLIVPVMVPRNRLAFVDVGQGDGIVLTHNHKSVLIDGGSSTKKNVGRYVLLPYLKYQGVKMLDYAILTHGDSDHYSGLLELIELGYVKHLVLGDTKNQEDVQEIVNAAKLHGTKVLYESSGDMIKSKGWKLTCIHPLKKSSGEKNAESQTFYLDIWNHRFLLTGDLEKEGEAQVIQRGLTSVDVLKVAHHGSKYATSNELLEATSPKYGVISVGEGNRYGHPHEDVLKRLKKYGIKVLDTRTRGMIWFENTKKGVEIHTKKG